jgi:hypothetical protein
VKHFRTIHVVAQPADRLYCTVRDRLPEIADMLDDVDSVRVLKRSQDSGGRLSLVNEWRARIRFPAVLEGFVRPDSIGWIDRAEWHDGEHRCRWVIEPTFLPGQVHCRGNTRYEPAIGGRGVRVTFEGEIEITLGGAASVRGPLDQTLSGFVESIVTTLIPRNFRKTLDAACALIERESSR